MVPYNARREHDPNRTIVARPAMGPLAVRGTLSLSSGPVRHPRSVQSLGGTDGLLQDLLPHFGPQALRRCQVHSTAEDLLKAVHEADEGEEPNGLVMLELGQDGATPQLLTPAFSAYSLNSRRYSR